MIRDIVALMAGTSHLRVFSGAKSIGTDTVSSKEMWKESDMYRLLLAHHIHRMPCAIHQKNGTGLND